MNPTSATSQENILAVHTVIKEYEMLRGHTILCLLIYTIVYYTVINIFVSHDSCCNNLCEICRKFLKIVCTFGLILVGKGDIFDGC
jgi:hypothetical protein